MKAKKIIFFLVVFCFVHHSNAKLKLRILPGSNQTDAYFPLLKGKTLGIVANQTSFIGKRHLVDSLQASGFQIKCVFAPEHGFRGESGAGEEIKNKVDSITGLPVISLYGNHVKPDSNDLSGIDIVLFDIQDIGVRFYTYISTLQYVMEACAERHIQLIILDRPNPHGFYIDGPVLDPKFSSFVGMQPVPVIYGMTIGEYARMLNGEGWLKNKVRCDLKVVPVRNYFHGSEYVLPVSPSPNLPDMDAIYLYPSVCFFEGTHVSLGRGTKKPFRFIGFPEYPSDSFSFTPRSIPGVATNPPYRDTLCKGIDLSGYGKNIFREPGIHLSWLIKMYSVYPEKGEFFTGFFDKLAGSDKLRKQIREGKSEKEIKKSWQPGIEKFKSIRKKYILYLDVDSAPKRK